MPSQQFMQYNPNLGRPQSVSATQSGGAGKGGQIIALNDSGQLGLDMMPTGIYPDTITAPASEAMNAGDFVNLWSDSGTIKVRKADASTTGKEAMGFVLASTAQDADASVYCEGSNNQLEGLVAGSMYFLSATTPGTATATPPSGAGKVVQFLGRATGVSVLRFDPEQGLVLAA